MIPSLSVDVEKRIAQVSIELHQSWPLTENAGFGEF
jgi:hypothetical protein